MRIEDDATVAEMVEDIGDDGVTFLEETMDLGVLNGETDLLEHMEDEGEVLVVEGVTGEAFIEDEEAEEGLSVEDGDGDGGTEKLEFFGDFAALESLWGGGLEDAAVAVKVGADAVVEGEGEEAEEGVIVGHGGGGG